jgi:hypothetical protein
MQVWALGLGFAAALRKFNRFVATALPRRQESSQFEVIRLSLRGA